jgi:hypothetical protein
MVVAEWLALFNKERVTQNVMMGSMGEGSDLVSFDLLSHNLRTNHNKFGYDGRQVYLDNHGALARPNGLNNTCEMLHRVHPYCHVTQSMLSKLHHAIVTERNEGIACSVGSCRTPPDVHVSRDCAMSRCATTSAMCE